MTSFNSEFADRSDDSIGLTFMRAYNLWHRKVSGELRALGITHPQFVALATLGYLSQSGGEVTQKDLSDASGIDPMTVSTIARNLERSGLISRGTAASDTRAKTVRLTRQGSERMNAALPVVERVDREFFDHLGRRKAALNAALLTLIQASTN